MHSTMILNLKITISLFILLIVYCVNIPILGDNSICKLCNCVQDYVECNNKKLTYIPKLPDNTTKFYFDGNNLPYIDEKTFDNLTNLNLKVLTLHRNNIRTIELGSFVKLTHLETLSIPSNLQIQRTSVDNLMSDLKNRHLNLFNLKHNGLNDIPDSFYYNNITTTQLDFSYNSFSELNLTKVTRARVKILLVKTMSIKHITMNRLPELENLTMTNNYLTKIPKFCENKNFFPSLANLSLYRNYIKVYNSTRMNCLDKLKILYLGNNNFERIKSESFMNLKSLQVLKISRQRYTTSEKFPFLHIDNGAFKNKQLHTLDLYDSGLDVSTVNISAFKACPNLKYLGLDHNKLCPSKYIGCIKKLNEILSPVKHLKKINLDNTGLHEIPGNLQNFHYLTEVYLDHNYIVSWRKGFWDNMKNLVTLSLSYNLIRVVEEGMLSTYLFEHVKKISLANNQLQCTCENVWFINWVNRERDKFDSYPGGYPCLNITEKICLNNRLFTSITAVCAILLLIFILTSVVYKYRWYIKYQIYIWRHQPRIMQHMAQRQFNYDVFVSYCHEDKAWVTQNLIPNLEQDDNLKLCIHERNFDPGRLIIDNIVEAIENSRRVLIILSNNFARSEWCLFELSLAQKHVLNLYSEPLSVVLLEEIDVEHMNSSLNVLLTTTTYISWYEDEDHIHLFWDRLVRSLK